MPDGDAGEGKRKRPPGVTFGASLATRIASTPRPEKRAYSFAEHTYSPLAHRPECPMRSHLGEDR
jgi:hypothetical protein